MHGVKSIETVLHYFVRATFSAAVKPNGYQCKNSKSLSRYFKDFAENFNRENLTFKEYNINQHHRRKLGKPRKRKIP